MATENFQLYESLSIAGRIGDLYDRMQAIRPGISRNTIRVAFMQPNQKSKLRPRIIEEARKVWEEHLAETAAEAAA
ncbi:MAG TPA: hypothetical protein PK228_01460 [Saprospiraceae bacterium]|nr:hypothetical protein [Saprospiraceae bacterium]